MTVLTDTPELNPAYITSVIEDSLEEIDSVLWESQMEKAVELLTFPETGTTASRENANKLMGLIFENLHSRGHAADAACAILEKLNRKGDIHEDWFSEEGSR